MHKKPIAFTFTGLLALAAGACGSNSPLPVAGEPRLIPGGGIGDGPIRGKLNVYVIDIYAAFGDNCGPDGGVGLLGADGLHPTPTGYSVMAGRFSAAIRDRFAVRGSFQ